MRNLIAKYQAFRPFTEAEAWALFRLAAFAEAVGWTLLISGILISQYLTPGNNIAVQIAGHMHGTLFLIYVTAVLVLWPSQHWSFRRTVVAGAASVPPFGTLLFEQWAAHRRRNRHWRRQLAVTTYHAMV